MNGWIVRYVALSPNDKTGFRARELKSIHVDAIGCFVKFVIHKNHSNKYNAFNQVISIILLVYCTVVCCYTQLLGLAPGPAHF